MGAQAPRVGKQHLVLLGTFLMPQGTGCWCQPPSLCSCPCRAPGDEEAQAENLIASNGKAPAPCAALLLAEHPALGRGGLSSAGLRSPSALPFAATGAQKAEN